MNLKLRLEKLCDTRSWVRLHFGDGTNITGRVLRVGHDYLEMESYTDSARDSLPDYAKHLVPLNLVKFITIESSKFAESERNRLAYLSEMEASSDCMPEMEK
jgi:hypothetical protein